MSSVDRVTKVCEVCGDEYQVRAKVSDERRVCGAECRSNYHFSKITNQNTIEAFRQTLRDFREHLGLEASDTDSTWRTEDLYGVTDKDYKSYNPLRRLSTKFSTRKRLRRDGDYRNVPVSFHVVFKSLFPSEWKKVKLYKLNPNNSLARTYKEDGKVNYKVLYPALKDFWYAWSEYLGRTPTLDDVYSLNADTLAVHVPAINPRNNAVRSFMPDFPCRRLFINGVYSKGIYVDNRTRKRTTRGKRAFRLQGEMNHSLYLFMKDLNKFFLCKDEKGRFKKSEWDDMDLHKRHTSSSGFGFLWDEDFSRRWVTEVAFPWLGINATGFPHNSSKETIQLCYDASLEMLRDIPKYFTFAANTFPHTTNKNGHETKGMGPILMKLWPDYDWDDLQFGAVLMGEQRAIRILRNTFDTVHHEWKMPMRNGKIAKFSDTRMPMRIDGFIEDYGIAVEVQGGQHYIGYDATVEERKWYTDLERTQWRDAAKKRAVKRQGHRIVYIPIYRHPIPVKGVHGKLPRWNWKLTTEESPKKGAVGLAELFEMQGAVDAARKLRGMVA